MQKFLRTHHVALNALAVPRTTFVNIATLSQISRTEQKRQRVSSI